MNKFIGKKKLVNTWNNVVDILIQVKNTYFYVIDSIVVKFFRPPYVGTIEQTIDKIANDKCSVSRYGDGELKLIEGKNISFQKHFPLLEERLKEVLISNHDDHIVCIPDVFTHNSQYTDSFADAWKKHLIHFRLKWYKHLDMKKKYYNAFISRCYLCFQDTKKSKYFFESIKKVWDKRDVVIIEGEYSRLGVGNDLFDNVNSIRRILGPKRDAFSMYNEIFEFVKRLDKNNLILVALGPTATILSYDLHKEGFQAIDIGHIDVEYEWYLKGAKKKISIKNKFVNEVNGGDFEEDVINDQYLDQIILNLNTSPESHKAI